MKLSYFLHDLAMAMREFDLDFDCFAKGQLESKEWVTEIMQDFQRVAKVSYGMVFVLCGWYGILPAMMWLKNINYSKIRSFDIDEKCWDISNRINRTSLGDEWTFQATTLDINKMNFDGHDYYGLWSYMKKKWFPMDKENPDTIINTSCEHTNADWFKKVPDGKIMVLQSNNFLGVKEHVNCVDSRDEFELMYPLQEVFYNGKMNFEKYTRFMRVGIK